MNGQRDHLLPFEEFLEWVATRDNEATHWKHESDLRSGIINHLQTTLADVRIQLERKDVLMTSGEPSAAAWRAWMVAVDACVHGLSETDGTHICDDCAVSTLDAFAAARVAEERERCARAICWRCRDKEQPPAHHHDDGGYVGVGDRVGGWYHDLPDGTYDECAAAALRAPEGAPR